MMQRAITCDHCDTTRPISYDEFQMLSLDGVLPAGWVRLAYHDPKRYSYLSDPTIIAGSAGMDLCSVHCTIMALNLLDRNE